MKQQHNNKFEQNIAGRFSNFELQPDKNNWEHISEEMQFQDLDQIVKKELESVELVPSEEVWKNVERKIPLNLLLRNQLNWLSKIAAILVIGMLITTYYNHPSNSEISNAEIKTPTQNTSSFPLVSEASEYVFEFEEETPSEEIASNVLSEEEKLQEADDFLANLLADEDEFVLQLDDDQIQQVLEPIDQLPIENITAMLDQAIPESSEYTADIQIKIPLIVVEENEVEELIELYDQNEAKKNNK